MFRSLIKRFKSFLHSGLFGFVVSLLVFVISYFLIQHYSESEKRDAPTPEQIEAYAKLFLENRLKESLGKRLDCSGYTREVYSFFSIHLPPSAAEQFKGSNRLEKEELRKGDLVFFITDGRTISHVGIYLDSLRFIHSPGKNKNVRIDQINDEYWQGKFICGGMIAFNSQRN